MGKRLGNLIRSARTDAGYTQEQLARKVKGVNASQIGRFERGEAEPTTQNVKDIAKACGVTQKSLLDAMPHSSSSHSTSSHSSSSSSGSKSSMQVTSTERRMVELYREATSADKKRVMEILRNSSVAGNVAEGIGNIIGDVIGDVLNHK